MVADKPEISEVLPRFIKFTGNSTLAAQNSRFDLRFLKYNAEKLGLEVKDEAIDTLVITRQLYPELDNHQLSTVANHLNIDLINAHRADEDAEATAQILLKCLEKDEGLTRTAIVSSSKPAIASKPSFHIKPDGTIGRCYATIRACPYGDASQHYSTKAAAEKAFQKKMEEEYKN
jgi:DNA polymerase-3 subunit alpha (Gram-positive type)